MCTATNLLRKVTLNIYSRIQLKLIYYIKATENEDVLKGKAKESRGFLKSGPTFPKSVPAVPPSVLAPGEHWKLSVFTLGCRAKDTLVYGAVPGPQLSILQCQGDCSTSCGTQEPSHESFCSRESGSQT